MVSKGNAMARIRINVDKLLAKYEGSKMDLPQELDIAYNTLKAYANNWVQRPDLEALAKICLYFGVTMDELFTLELSTTEKRQWSKARATRTGQGEDQASSEAEAAYLPFR